MQLWSSKYGILGTSAHSNISLLGADSTKCSVCHSAYIVNIHWKYAGEHVKMICHQFCPFVFDIRQHSLLILISIPTLVIFTMELRVDYFQLLPQILKDFLLILYCQVYSHALPWNGCKTLSNGTVHKHGDGSGQLFYTGDVHSQYLTKPYPKLMVESSVCPILCLYL